MLQNNYLGRGCRRSGSVVGVGEAVLVHDPVGLGAAGRAALVVDEGLLEADEALGVGGAADGPVGAGGLPEAPLRRPARPPPVRLPPVPRHVEVPLSLAYPC